MSTLRKTGGARDPANIDKSSCRKLRTLIQQPEMTNWELQDLLDEAEARQSDEDDLVSTAASLFYERQDRQNAANGVTSATASSSAGKRPAPAPAPSSNPPQQRQRMALAAFQEKIWLVIHDREPQDSGSDYNFSAGLPARQDTKVVSAHKTYNGAARAAAQYVLDNELISDETDATEDDMEDDAFVLAFDWMGEGVYRPEREMAGPGDDDDRVTVMEKDLEV